MNDIQFRRNTQVYKNKGRRIGIFALGLLVVILLLMFVVKPFQRIEKQTIAVHYLSDTIFLVNTDTTYYAQFASKLMWHVEERKNKQIPLELLVYLPKGKTVADVEDILLIANALQVPFQLKIEQ